MELSNHVTTEYLQLLNKLNKEGIRSVTSLPYESYMRTALWKKIRTWVLDRDGKCCIVCKRQAEEVHHRDYKEPTLIGEAPDMLVSLCKFCHEKIEYDNSGGKRRDLLEKDHRLSTLSSLHAIIEKTGMEVELRVREANGVSNIEVAYMGPSSYLQFYTLSSLAYGFCVDIMFKNREKLALHMPFGREKLAQKTGAKLLSRSDMKPIAAVWASEDSIRVRQSKNCPVQITHELQAYITGNQHYEYWRLPGVPTNGL